jgi:hypothetical protein
LLYKILLSESENDRPGPDYRVWIWRRNGRMYLSRKLSVTGASPPAGQSVISNHHHFGSLARYRLWQV